MPLLYPQSNWKTRRGWEFSVLSELVRPLCLLEYLWIKARKHSRTLSIAHRSVWLRAPFLAAFCSRSRKCPSCHLSLGKPILFVQARSVASFSRWAGWFWRFFSVNLRALHASGICYTSLLVWFSWHQRPRFLHSTDLRCAQNVRGLVALTIAEVLISCRLKVTWVLNLNYLGLRDKRGVWPVFFWGKIAIQYLTG